MTTLTREQLDRMAIDAGGRVTLRCGQHPEAPAEVVYQDGAVRVLCAHCGFEAMRIAVGSRGV